ncbi:MAG TPA: crotonase/enoyl-CoA hydratase family protein [Pseudomonadota bacterium]|nr:crotonase/enoyl-CoA hydratase family protein [Pseudomonadota bacterium]
MVTIEKQDGVWTVVLSRPQFRNAVDRATAEALSQAFRDFDQDETARVAVLFGDGGHFCAGADLKAIGNGSPNRLSPDGDGPLGPTRLRLSKPTIAAISGYAVAGGLELACFCDLRVADETAVLGVFCRRFGVPLIDGGTVRLPQIVGLGRALDLILTGRPVDAAEALSMGLVNRVVPVGTARESAENLARALTRLPQHCLRSDRRAALLQMDDPKPLSEALRREFELGMQTILTGETLGGATAFVSGTGRHGQFLPEK